jgi:hypothetical protein
LSKSDTTNFVASHKKLGDASVFQATFSRCGARKTRRESKHKNLT